MPIYEYACKACGHRFEKLVRAAGELPKSCPQCGKTGLKKAFSTFSATVGHRHAKSSCAAAASCPAGGCCGGDCPL